MSPDLLCERAQRVELFRGHILPLLPVHAVDRAVELRSSCNPESVIVVVTMRRSRESLTL